MTVQKLMLESRLLSCKKCTGSGYWRHFEHLDEWVSRGQGRYELADAYMYEGNYIDGVKQGYGRLIYAEGCYYEGLWEHGKISGPGTYVSKEGKRYPYILSGRCEPIKKVHCGKLLFPFQVLEHK